MEKISKGFIATEETLLDFEHWSTTELLPKEIRDSIRGAELVLLPDDGFRDYSGPVFPVGTEELFQFLRDRLENRSAVEIAVEDANYKEVALHSEILRLAVVLVRKIAAQATIGLIVDYLKKRLGSRFKNAEVRSTMVIDLNTPTVRKALRVSYEGPADTFERVIGETISKLGQQTAADQKLIDEHEEPKRNSRIS